MPRQDSPSRYQDQFMLRLTRDGMRDQLKDAAKLNGRSLNSEINQRLEASFEPSQPASGTYAQIAKLIDPLIEAEVQRRLRAIASQIGGA